MSQTRENGTSLFWVEVTFEWYEGAIVFLVFIFIFFFRSNGIRDQLDENNFVAVMVIFFKSVIPELLDHSYTQSSFPSIMRHLDNGIWKTPYN